MLRWGLIPSWAKDRKVAWKFINARAESVATTGAFKTAYAKRRCLVPVDGFYEWRTVGKVKQPYAIGIADGQPFTLAGLWENWKDPDTGEWTRTFTIVTTNANELVAKLHDRMPVIIAEQDRDRWLSDPEPGDLLRPYPADLMTMWPVSRDVNAPKNDIADLLEPTEDACGAWPVSGDWGAQTKGMRMAARRTLSSGVAAAWVVVAATSAQAANRSEAEAIATRTGEIIGGASACGIPEGELVALGAKVIRWARDTARSAAELKRAQEAHEAAVQRSADRVGRRGASACEGTVRTFWELERKMR